MLDSYSEGCPPKPWRRRTSMYHVYIIQALNYPDQIYVGCTTNLNKRLSNHNSETSVHTKKYAPWRLAVYLSFDSKDKAYAFEEYLKSGSGRAFRDKRLL
jgi:putative endonuclease